MNEHVPDPCRRGAHVRALLEQASEELASMPAQDATRLQLVLAGLLLTAGSGVRAPPGKPISQ